MRYLLIPVKGYLVDIAGFSGGYSEEVLKSLAVVAAKHQVNKGT